MIQNEFEKGQDCFKFRVFRFARQRKQIRFKDERRDLFTQGSGGNGYSGRN
jgi:hypothetical protein